MPIRVLTDQVASQIAAGEVVERPASVVKELVENALDAGATDVRVEAREGGKRLIRVTDDGVGVPADEVDLVFLRHSTSKLASAEDLDYITTLGFRGEALASIAAVSRVTFETHAADEPVGTLLRIEGGEIAAQRESGRPPGTAVTVETLFYNLPARRKFLRTERTERRHIDAWLTRYAMAYPDVRFTLRHGDRVTFQSPGNGSLRDVLVAVYGVDVAAEMIALATDADQPESDIRVRGFVSPPSLHRSNSTYITLFVNGRWVQDRSLSYAVIQAYHTLLPKGRYPLAVVMLELPPGDVDVNVHPTKAEVRFRDGDAAFRTIQRAVRSTLMAQAPVPRFSRPEDDPTGSTGGRQTWPTASSPGREGRLKRLTSLGGERQLQFEDRPAAGDDVGAREFVSQEERLPPLRVVGQLGATYIIAEGPQGMFLIDQHAAHERVLFERLLRQRQQAEIRSQALLEPQTVELSPEAMGALEEHLEALVALGFELEPFGGSTMLVRTVPALVADENPRRVLEDIAAALLSSDAPLGERTEEAVARQVCKQAAVKAGQTMAREEMEELIRTLEQAASPRTCPHGRPTMIHLSVAHLARAFGRT